MDYTRSPQLIIVDWLKENEISAYLPTQHDGLCNPGEQYVVVKPGAASRLREFSTTQHEYLIMCYVHRELGSKLEDYTEEVIEALNGLRDHLMIRNSHFASPHYYDDALQAHMITLTYTVYMKLEQGGNYHGEP